MVAPWWNEEKISGPFYLDTSYRNSSSGFTKEMNTSAIGFDSNRQTKDQSLNFSQETRPKTKFFSLLIYAGYPMQ